jgi:hypothetical protein
VSCEGGKACGAWRAGPDGSGHFRQRVLLAVLALLPLRALQERVAWQCGLVVHLTKVRVSNVAKYGSSTNLSILLPLALFSRLGRQQIQQNSAKNCRLSSTPPPASPFLLLLPFPQSYPPHPSMDEASESEQDGSAVAVRRW